MSLNGKNAIVTGGCSGIGFALTKELLRQEIQSVGILDWVENFENLKNLRTEFKGKTIEFYRVDVKSRDEIKNALGTFVIKHQYIDVLINSAGVFSEICYEDVILVNLLGLINCTYETMNYMSISRKGRGGRIFNISSVCGMLHLPGYSVYTASKHGVSAFTKTMANDINKTVHGIDFIALCPGKTISNMTVEVSKVFLPEFVPLGPEYDKSMPVQTPDQLAKCFREILPIAHNGSAWIISKGRFQKYTPDDFDPEDFVKL